MITFEEIRSHASRLQLSNIVIEKDYALGWLLAGFHNHPATKDDWVFKGGTCLKKCYFETYRFSEDLDFSYRGTGQPTVDDLVLILSEISDWILDQSGLSFPKEAIKFESFTNPRGSVSIQGKVAYRGPVRPQVGIAQLPRIKIDLTFDEPLQLSPVIRGVEHPYSDSPPNGFHVLAYAYEEIFAEKVRALIQRLRPRDLYDVIHFHRRMDLNPDRIKVYRVLSDKCALRGVPVPTVENIEAHENRSLLESEWENQLKHQIQILPSVESFLDELPLALQWIHGIEAPVLAQISAFDTDESELSVISEPVKNLILPGPASSFIDRIRFAATNHLQINLGYQGKHRNIEPYALARSSEGHLLLRAVKTATGESRIYRLDRVQSMTVTAEVFRPRYAIEITSAGQLPVHQLSRKDSSRQAPTRRVGSQRAMTYIYRCPICYREFERSSRDSGLHPHKNSMGRPCHGRTGIFVRTEY